MPNTKEIEVFFISKSVVQRDEARRWLDYIGADDYEIPTEEEATDAETLISLSGRRCYLSFGTGLNKNISRVRKEMSTYLENILRTGHGSVTEHATYTLAIEGVTRTFTAEMNRHRAGWAISEGSLRFIRFDDINYWLPTLLRDRDSDTWELRQKKIDSRIVFRKAFEDQEGRYRELEKIWKDELAPESKFKYKKQVTSMMRRIIGMGACTGGVWTGNIRALRHVITMRTEPAAEEEILYVFCKVVKKLAELEPNLFGDFTETEGGFWVPQYRKV